MNRMNKKQSLISDILPLSIGEVGAVILVAIGGLALDYGNLIEFSPYMISGAILGAVVSVINYLVLAISVDHEVNKYLSLRGSREMNEEEAAEFAKANSGAVQKAIARSSIIRTVSILGCLVIAFLTGLFNPVATIITLLAYRPILTAVEIIKARRQPAPNPDNYIKYENNEEKEND